MMLTGVEVDLENRWMGEKTITTDVANVLNHYKVSIANLTECIKYIYEYLLEHQIIPTRSMYDTFLY